MDTQKLIDEVIRLAEAGKSFDYVVTEAQRSIAFLADDKALRAAFEHGKERMAAMEAARELIQAACPHPPVLHRERPGAFDGSGCSWGTEASCGACGKDLGYVR